MNRNLYVSNRTELAENIKIIREGLELKQREVASFLKIDRSTYAYYETGKTLPDIFTLIKLSEFFCTQIEVLLLKDGGYLVLSAYR